MNQKRIMNKDHIQKLRPFLLRDLVDFFYEKIHEVITEEEITQIFNEVRRKTKLIVKNNPIAFCRSISVIVSLCLNIYGFNSEPKDIKVFLGNKYARSVIDEMGVEGLKEELRKDDRIYTMGCGFTEDINDFHTIVTIDKKYLLDMTMKGMKRKEEGIIINNYFCTLEELIKKYKSILYYEIKLGEINMDCMVLRHPNLINIINYVLEEISKRLNLTKIQIDKIKDLTNNYHSY
jgi:hypothetical protein